VMPSDESKKWLQLRQVAGQVTVHDVLLGWIVNYLVT
jgi:hypothetical protein